MWLHLPDHWIIIINILGIPLVHLGIAYLTTLLPNRLFLSTKNPATQKPNIIYQKFFHVRRWKHLLPDAAGWFNGFPKKSLQSTKPEYLQTFIQETRRGEFSHWLQLGTLNTFILWNPYPANLIILGYCALSNFPCIINLRHTRYRLANFLNKISQ